MTSITVNNMTMNTTTPNEERQFTADDRIRVVLRGLSGDISINELCRREGIKPRMYYAWCLTFLEAGKQGIYGAQTVAAESDAGLQAGAACSAVACE